jgi:hypothetical protein
MASWWRGYAYATCLLGLSILAGTLAFLDLWWGVGLVGVLAVLVACLAATDEGWEE